MTQSESLIVATLDFLKAHPDDPVVSASLAELLEGGLVTELAEMVAGEGPALVLLSGLLTNVDDEGLFSSKLPFAHMVPFHFERGNVTSRALRAWLEHEELRRIAAHFANDRIMDDDLHGVMLHECGWELDRLDFEDTLDAGDLLFGIGPGTYNWAMRGADRFERATSAWVGLQAAPVFGADVMDELGRYEATVFPATGEGTLHDLLSVFCNPGRTPCLLPPCLRGLPYDQKLATQDGGLDPGHDGIEHGWHAVAMPRPGVIGRKNYQRLVAAPYHEQEAAIAELCPGWRIASAVETLTWCLLHKRLYDTWPVGDVALRARPRDGAEGLTSVVHWMVHFGVDSVAPPRVYPLQGHQIGSNLILAISRIPG